MDGRIDLDSWFGPKRRGGNGPPLVEALDAAYLEAPKSQQPALSKLRQEMGATGLRAIDSSKAAICVALELLIRDMVAPVNFVREHTAALEYFGVPCDERRWSFEAMAAG